MDALREQWLILISTPVYMIIIGLEILLSHLQQRKLYRAGDSVANIYLLVLNSCIDLSFRIIYLAVLNYFYVHAILTVQHIILYWLLLVLLEDMLYYWLHRIDHQVRFFWAVHVTHHSSKHMNFTVGFRSSVFQPLYRFLYFIPIAWLGFKPIDIVFIYAATQIWGIFVHTELIRKMGFLEYFMVTPSHHRVHHGCNPKYLDKNMGMFLIIWDKLFGTFQEELPAEEYQAIEYGLTQDLENSNALYLVFHEWVQIRKDVIQPGIRFRDRLQYLFGPPGWSHDGSRKTSKELSREENTGQEIAGWTKPGE